MRESLDRRGTDGAGRKRGKVASREKSRQADGETDWHRAVSRCSSFAVFSRITFPMRKGWRRVAGEKNCLRACVRGSPVFIFEPLAALYYNNVALPPTGGGEGATFKDDRGSKFYI